MQFELGRNYQSTFFFLWHLLLFFLFKSQPNSCVFHLGQDGNSGNWQVVRLGSEMFLIQTSSNLLISEASGARWFSQFHISNLGFMLSSCGSTYFQLFFGHFSLKLQINEAIMLFWQVTFMYWFLNVVTKFTTFTYRYLNIEMHEESIGISMHNIIVS